MTEYLYAMYVMCCTALFLCDLCCACLQSWNRRVPRVRTGRFTELEPEGSQSLGARTHRVIASSGLYVLCVWYFGELTKLRAYSVLCYVVFRFLSVSRDGTGLIVHTRERVIFWRILVFYASENGAMFCNLIMNEIFNKCSKNKMII